eukprot:scaffold18772_cov112-Isochrysis_galbana.AAC.9
MQRALFDTNDASNHFRQGWAVKRDQERGVAARGVAKQRDGSQPGRCQPRRRGRSLTGGGLICDGIESQQWWVSEDTFLWQRSGAPEPRRAGEAAQ